MHFIQHQQHNFFNNKYEMFLFLLIVNMYPQTDVICYAVYTYVQQVNNQLLALSSILSLSICILHLAMRNNNTNNYYQQYTGVHLKERPSYLILANCDAHTPWCTHCIHVPFSTYNTYKLKPLRIGF